ncbi:TRAP transporter substrate-binding protein [Oceanibacterium hippocampi]|uniref:Bacterial extracellular solute-binding protein, family 7 n=1 Tax=Oceanibacterium hippocampi TaxID=745714 RepID=A0A1Y5RSQ5_9PROT|nr:TRAP transporter substrate-binding protein [Oceanibacterium hippocampi]SLN24469.1 Bacterial extracellular solute-binding protein, family 7 [Oceanibacterium hippocampi]
MLREMVTGILTAGLMTGAAAAASWDMPTPYPDNNFHTMNIKEFAEDVAKATDGALEIRVHSGGSLFKHPEIKNAVRSGQVPIGEFLLSRLSNENAVFQVDSVPFLATSYADGRRLWAASREKIEALLEKQNMMVLFAVPWPPQGLYANKPIEALDDLKGVKFRAYNTATERLAQLAGAVPTQVEAADVPQAFATGQVQAMITSPSTGANSKAWDFLDHYYQTAAWLPKNVVVVNTRTFRKLDEATRQAVLDAAARAEERGWAASEAETNAKEAELKDNGIKVSPPNAALAGSLSDIGKSMVAEWKETAGADGAAILAKYENK